MDGLLKNYDAMQSRAVSEEYYLNDRQGDKGGHR